MKNQTAAAFALVISLGFGAVQAQTPAPDNTKTNAAKMNSTAKTSTADGQKNNSSDVAMTQRIRKSVMADKSLSTYAHNVKVVTVNGAVTLNGVVRDSREKDLIDKMAEEVAGNGKVTNDLKIAPPK